MINYLLIPLALAISLVTWPATALGLEVFFTPSTACEDQIVKAMGGAKEEVVVAVYSINNPKIMLALK